MTSHFQRLFVWSSYHQIVLAYFCLIVIVLSSYCLIILSSYHFHHLHSAAPLTSHCQPYALIVPILSSLLSSYSLESCLRQPRYNPPHPSKLIPVPCLFAIWVVRDEYPNSNNRDYLQLNPQASICVYPWQLPWHICHLGLTLGCVLHSTAWN